MSDAPSEIPVGFGVFHLPQGSTLRDAAERLSRLEPDKFRVPDAFAFIFSETVDGSFEEISGITSYEAGRPHYIVDSHADRERIRRIENGVLILEELPALREKICESDLLDLMLSDGSACVLEPSGNYHFITPALRHTDRFIRIGDLVRNRSGLDRLVFWLGSAVRGVNGVLVDSWSISSVALRAMQRSKLDVPFDCLPEHPAQNPEGCRAVVEELVRQMGGVGRLLVIVSISGSGQMIEQIESALVEYGAELEVEFLSLYGFTSTPDSIKCMARIEDKGNTHRDGECEFCKEDSIAIPIDPSSYHLRSWRENPVRTIDRHFDPSKDFINAYKGEKGVFFVHRDDPSDSRHHAFDIDMKRLLEIPRFYERHLDVLKQFVGKVDLIVCPTHEVAGRMVDIATGVLQKPCIVHDTLDVRHMNETDKVQMVGAERLLIIDDTLNSGSRIHRYIQSLREGGYGKFTNIDVHVGIARPETEAQLKQVSRYISNRHPWEGEVYYTESLLLPRWGTSQCPWCKEFDRLSKLEETYGKPPVWLTERTRHLRNKTLGVADDPLLLFPGCATPKLGAGSVVCDEGAPALAALFAVASGLQRHRSDPDIQHQLHPDFPLANVFSPEMFRRYSEGLIRAILLRTLTRHEFGSQAGIESRDFLLGQIKQENQGIVAGELVAALGRRAFPAISAGRFVSDFGGFLPIQDLQRLAKALDLPQ